jgi:hypothetical protein
MELTITKDRQDLERLETVIVNNLRSFYELGGALAEIRDRELYKIKNGGEYKTFEAYCRDALDLSRPRAYQLIGAAQVQENLSTMVDKTISERQARPLINLEPEQQRSVWKKAVETAPEGKITAAHISKIVRSISGKPLCKKQKPEPEPAAPETAMSVAELLISQLEHLADDDPDMEKVFSLIESWIEQRRKSIKIQRKQAFASTNHTLFESYDQQMVGI